MSNIECLILTLLPLALLLTRRILLSPSRLMMREKPYKVRNQMEAMAGSACLPISASMLSHGA